MDTRRDVPLKSNLLAVATPYRCFFFCIIAPINSVLSPRPLIGLTDSGISTKWWDGHIGGQNNRKMSHKFYLIIESNSQDFFAIVLSTNLPPWRQVQAINSIGYCASYVLSANNGSVQRVIFFQSYVNCFIRCAFQFTRLNFCARHLLLFATWYSGPNVGMVHIFIYNL